MDLPTQQLLLCVEVSEHLMISDYRKSKPEEFVLPF